LLSKIAANTYVKRTCSKAVSLLVTSVEARDFVSVDFVTKEPDGTFMNVSFTDPTYENTKPPIKNITRGDLHIGGWELKPLGGNRTKMTLLGEADIKGNIPTVLVKTANKDQGM
jgi:hypothetical protein